MSRTELCKNAYDIGTAILRQSPWNNLKGACKCLVGPLVDTFNSLSFFHESAGELHLESTATRAETWVNNDVASDAESVL